MRGGLNGTPRRRRGEGGDSAAPPLRIAVENWYTLPHALVTFSIDPLGASTWTYEGWKGQVYERQYAKTSFARACLGEYCQYQYHGESLFRTVGTDSAFYHPPPAPRFHDQTSCWVQWVRR